jgi:hypothetical protein
MPIAAKLSRTLYDTLGDEAAEAMVDWMQRVDTQRFELRELNDLSFERIDVRFGEARAESELRFAELRAEIDIRFARIDTRFAELRDEMHTGFATLEAKLDRRFAELIKWSFVFWVSSTVTLVVALAAVARFAR